LSSYILLKNNLETGAAGEARTHDLLPYLGDSKNRIRQALYRLSYSGVRSTTKRAAMATP
jgi:hypothetical protein